MVKSIYFRRNMSKKHAKPRDKGYNIVWSLFLVSAAVLSGCEQVDPELGYSMRSLYRTDVRTVAVEMFQSESFRRGVEFELTRAVSEQLELHSPLKVVSDRRKADTLLYGTITRIDERVLSRQRQLDRPLENEVILLVRVTWKDLRSGELILDDQPIRVSGRYASLLGAGRASAAREAANEAAVRIVEAMEEPW